MQSTPPSAPSEVPCVRLEWPVHAVLGEGPLWIAAEHALWFVDIEGRALHRYRPEGGVRDTFPMPGRPSFVVPDGEGELLVGMDRGLWKFRGGQLGGCIADVPAPAGCRTNDAVVDARGRLWFGTMDLAQHAPIGQVHRFEGGAVHAVGGHCPITNGPAISPDGSVLYHVDTLGGLVWAFDIRTRDVLADGRVFARIDPADGTPDGVTVDAQGGVWVALWGGWAVRRYSPAGDLRLTVPIPCAQVTKIAFGGDSLRTAFVTTARLGLADKQRQEQPEAGSVFAFEAPVPGLPAYAVARP